MIWGADEMERIAISEEMYPEKEWFKQAKEQTIETLPDFINHIMGDYAHDYGTICHALSACAIAAAWAANNHPQGGITGFQAGFVVWDFVRQWQYPFNKCGMRIIDYDNMLFPQYEDKFDKTISKSTWEALQKEAKERLKEKAAASPTVVTHWESIVSGKIPFGYALT